MLVVTGFPGYTHFRGTSITHISAVQLERGLEGVDFVVEGDGGSVVVTVASVIIDLV